MIQATFAFMALRQLQPPSRQIRSIFLWLTVQPEGLNNYAILRYPYRFASLIMSCLSASSPQPLPWYVIVKRATPKTLYVRHSDLFSFCQAWIVVCRFNSALRPEAFYNQGLFKDQLIQFKLSQYLLSRCFSFSNALNSDNFARPMPPYRFHQC